MPALEGKGRKRSSHGGDSWSLAPTSLLVVTWRVNTGVVHSPPCAHNQALCQPLVTSRPTELILPAPHACPAYSCCHKDAS